MASSATATATTIGTRPPEPGTREIALPRLSAAVSTACLACAAVSSAPN